MSAVLFWASVALVGYVYAGYPVLVTALAHLCHTRSWPAAPLPKVTLIIAAFNEESVIGDKLEAVLRLDYPRELLQVVVAADGSDDGTVEVAEGYADRGVELVHQPLREGKLAAVNRAAQWATGEILVFSDSNNRFDRPALAELVAPFADPKIGMTVGYKMVTGRGGLGHSEGAYWKYEAHIRRMETRLGCTVGVNGEICAIRRDLFREAPRHIINDDQWMSQRVIKDGWNVVFCPDAISRESVSASAAEEKERRSRMVAGQYQIFASLRRSLPWRRPLVLWMLASHKLLRPLVPLGMAGALVGATAAVLTTSSGSGVLALGGPWAWVALGSQIVFYGAAAGGRRLERLGPLGYLPRFLVDSNVAAVRGLWRHIRGSQTPLWNRVRREAS